MEKENDMKEDDFLNDFLEDKAPAEEKKAEASEVKAEKKEKKEKKEKVERISKKKEETKAEEKPEDKPGAKLFGLRTTANREDQVMDFVSSNAAKKNMEVYSVVSITATSAPMSLACLVAILATRQSSSARPRLPLILSSRSTSAWRTWRSLVTPLTRLSSVFLVAPSAAMTMGWLTPSCATCITEPIPTTQGERGILAPSRRSRL